MIKYRNEKSESIMVESDREDNVIERTAWEGTWKSTRRERGRDRAHVVREDVTERTAWENVLQKPLLAVQLI